MRQKLPVKIILGALLLCLSGCAGQNLTNTVVRATPYASAVPSPAADTRATSAPAPAEPAAATNTVPQPVVTYLPTPEPTLRVVSTPAPPPSLLQASFSTSYEKGNKNRIHNIKRAAEAIDGIIIAPGADFSYNDAVGPTTKANGYKKARIFVRGKDAEGYGGGVCQVSSTLYNAAEAAGLTILERHPHSKAVSYVAKDRDAATSFGGIDLRLSNPHTFAVCITVVTTDTAVTIFITQI